MNSVKKYQVNYLITIIIPLILGLSSLTKRGTVLYEGLQNQSWKR